MKIVNEITKLDASWKIAIYVLVVFVISWLFSRLLRFVIVAYLRNSKSEKYKKTSIQFLKNSIKFFVGLFAFIYIIITVPAFKSKATFIFSGAGILAAIIGFAAQAAISNLIAGAFIVIFKPFRVGDYIKLDDNRIGIVEDITLRHTVINNFENKRLIIPNSIISTESVLNHTIEDSHILSFNNFKLGLFADIDLAKKIIEEEALKLDGVIDFRTPTEVLTTTNQIEVRVIDVFESYIHIRAYVWINNPFEEFKIKCALKEAVHKRFIAENIDMPIPLRKIYNA
ncbi:MAG: mechanosensitive ion channel family protein [Flavobacteriaceae bacterium]|nr:mechanosensitive ion channel family protein [Flavobacteriaceae bacterium]